MDSWETTDGFIDKSKTLERPRNHKPNLAGQQATVSEFSVCLQNTWRLVHMCHEGGKPTEGRLSSWPGLGLAFLCIRVLGFNYITTGSTHVQGIGGSLLSILTAFSALSGLMGTVLFPRLRGHYGLVTMGIISSWFHMGCLTLGVFSVFAPGSPFDLAIFLFPLSKNFSSSHELLKDQVCIYSFERNMNQPILPNHSSSHWTNSTGLFE